LQTQAPSFHKAVQIPDSFFVQRNKGNPAIFTELLRFPAVFACRSYRQKAPGTAANIKFLETEESISSESNF
jgi:hypothetical protein